FQTTFCYVRVISALSFKAPNRRQNRTQFPLNLRVVLNIKSNHDADDKGGSYESKKEELPPFSDDLCLKNGDFLFYPSVSE
ncbi:hypothetical protein, partial [Neisseria sicca]|uniref:hypothetical protein n=1 Tax=Neisseria sicca TaxID=490 RepID=UPI003C71640A